jgi:hypothetical protein
MSNNGADYNAFGYDPDGRFANLAAYFFGPAWVPTNHDHLPSFQGITAAPPRYGPPAPQQVGWLPAVFVPRSPPFHFGVPNPPYVSDPGKFDKDDFAPLIRSQRRRHVEPDLSRYGRRILEGLPIGEVKDAGEVPLTRNWESI